MSTLHDGGGGALIAGFIPSYAAVPFHVYRRSLELPDDRRRWESSLDVACSSECPPVLRSDFRQHPHIPLNQATNKQWQALAEELGFGLIACFFPDKDKSSAQYCHADNGSGEGLLEAMEEFSKVEGHPDIEEAACRVTG